MISGVALALIIPVGLWLLSQQAPAVPHGVTGLLMIIVGGLLGLRVGAESAARFLQGVIRLNGYLADQNSALSEQNQLLLKRTVNHEEQGE